MNTRALDYYTQSTSCACALCCAVTLFSTLVGSMERRHGDARARAWLLVT